MYIYISPLFFCSIGSTQENVRISWWSRRSLCLSMSRLSAIGDTPVLPMSGGAFFIFTAWMTFFWVTVHPCRGIFQGIYFKECYHFVLLRGMFASLTGGWNAMMSCSRLYLQVHFNLQDGNERRPTWDKETEIGRRRELRMERLPLDYVYKRSSTFESCRICVMLSPNNNNKRYRLEFFF